MGRVDELKENLQELKENLREDLQELKERSGDLKDDMIEKISEVIPEKLTEKAQEIIAEKLPEKLTDLVPEKMVEMVPDKLSDLVPEKLSDLVPDKLSEMVPDKMADLVPDKLSDLVPDKLSEMVQERVAEHRQKKVFSGVENLPNGQADETLVPGCICCEGGAFRGLYGEGVLDALMEAGLNFEACIGVSAGALNGISYVSGQIGRSARTNLTYRHNSKFVGVQALKESHSILNLDFLLEDMNEVDPLNEERFYRPEQRYVAVATNCITGEPMYYEKGKCKDLMSAVKASASMPFISPMVDVDGTPCLDGGCSCKIPYQWALDENYDKIVVIKTRERGYRKENKESESASHIYRKHFLFAEVLDHSNIMYNEQCDEIDRLEQEGRIFVIAPSEPVTVGRVEGDMEKLGALYYLGYNDAKEQIPALLEYLKKEPETATRTMKQSGVTAQDIIETFHDDTDLPEEYRPKFNELLEDAIRITMEINGNYHTPQEIRALMSRLIGRKVDETFRLFPPFYTDFGKNIHFGKNVFVNGGCHFQDQGGIFIGDGCMIGHNVVFATIDHDLLPRNNRRNHFAPIHLGEKVWIGSNATILAGVTIGDWAVVAAGAVVTKDVPPYTVVGGVPAKVLRTLTEEEIGE